MFVVRHSINTLHQSIIKKHSVLLFPKTIVGFHLKMGSSNCKSFSPSKAAAKCKVDDTGKNRHESTATSDRCATPPENPEDYIEGVVCQENDLKENEMKTFELGEGKVLLIKQNGVINAIGNKCTHYGAPLVSGALGDGRVRCQWHGACFNIKTGDIEDYPGFDSLPCYKVSIENGNVKVRGKATEIESSKRVKGMVKRVASEPTTIAVIGGGPSGGICVEVLRQEGFTGRIVMICKEPYLPYDRVKVSKSLDTEITKLQFRDDAFYETNNIEVLRNTEVTGIDVGNKTLSLSNGDSVKFSKCYIATGSKPRLPDIAGSMLKNVITMRDYSDSQAVLERIDPNKKVVCFGGGFIGLEAAAYCINKVASVTVVIRDNVPFKAVFGEDIGRRIMQLYEEKGIKFVTNANLTMFDGKDGTITGVTLNNGEKISCDLCIVGIGSTLYTQFLKGSDVNLNMDGSVPVNLHLETNVPGIYAGGDIANAPVFSNNNQPATIGHFPLAHYHGRIAALNMIGKSTELRAVPFFWTQLFGKSFRYAGHGRPDEVQVHGDLKELKFVAFYFKDDRVIAMSSCNKDPLVAKFAELLSQGKSLCKNDVLDPSNGWIEVNKSN